MIFSCFPISKRTAAFCFSSVSSIFGQDFIDSDSAAGILAALVLGGEIELASNQVEKLGK